jgi:apolipoprotein N-acyltransferase
VFLPAIVSGLLLWAAFFPLDLGPLAFVALVPWLTLVRAPVSRKRRYLAAYLGGFIFFAVALQWVRVAHPMMYLSWLGLALACPVFWCVGLFLLRRIDRLKVIPFAVSVPVVWVALEYARAHFPTGFPFLKYVGAYQMVGFGWYFLGYTQHHFEQLIQIADLGGVYAVSFLVGAVNGLALEWLIRSPRVRAWLRWEPEPRPSLARLVPLSLCVGGLLVAAVAYGTGQPTEFAPGPRVAAIQVDVTQDDKMGDRGGLFDRYNRLCLTAAAAGPDLVIWPETCYPFGWWTVAPGVPPDRVPGEFAKSVRDLNGAVRFFAAGPVAGATIPWKVLYPPWRTNVLLGLNSYEWDGNREVPANTAILIDAAGNNVARYDKMHLVPFGEYVPFRETLPWMQTFTPYKWDYSCRPGESYTRFPLKVGDRTFTFGCLICYEDSDPYLARQYVLSTAPPGQPWKEGYVPPVDFLVNISNDGWFNGTEEHEQHLAICRFRAVEARRSVVRAVNMGISAVIDPSGRVIALPGENWAASKKSDGIVSAVVPIDTRESWYARLGDWLPAACWGLLVLGHVAGMIRRRRGAT